ncbi:MAG: aconitate hydratase [Nitrososphaeraceae archaeon]|nr:aconitate hydratase [Nitrososphaeraceae archaeon]
MSVKNESISVETTAQQVKRIYEKSSNNIAKYKEIYKKDMPFSISEKILIGHLTHIGDNSHRQNLQRGKSYVFLRPDRVALQDVTGQMTLLQFMQSGLNRTTIPTTVHCDHLIQARVEGNIDTKAALYENNEVYKFLESASRKYGVGFWKPGAGIIHQVVLENYAFPGGLMIGTDSHTPNAGGLGMLAVGVGGLDAAETMAGMPWEILYPKRIGVYLTGELSGWASPKDVILYVASQLTVSGGTNSIIEYFGPGADSISCTGKATITNMGAEIGATCSIFEYDTRMETYLRATNRDEIANLANDYKDILIQDPEIYNNPEKYFDRVIRINLSLLEPYVVGPHTPDLARPISKMKDDVITNHFVNNISVALVGSCTNSSYEDMSRAADVADQASGKGSRIRSSLLVTPGSEMIRATIDRDGQMKSLQKIGATVLANACGPCIGQWSRPELKKGEPNTIVTSYNRNFPGRNDGKRETMNFIASPEIVIAFALGGTLSFNPLTDSLTDSNGLKFKLQPPKIAPEVPSRGFVNVTNVYVPPASDSKDVEVLIDEKSERLQKLEPFPQWDGKDFVDLPILAKVKGKCTTDHISPAGAWLMYRGHIDRISDNLLLGAVNFYHDDQIGMGKDILTNQIETYPHIAREYKAVGLKWVIIGDENYGEGSSREHAAMTPRYLGCAAVISKSFARIHETNLKKQGVLALTFENSADYYKIEEDDKISILELDKLEPDKLVKCKITHKNGNLNKEFINLKHSYNRYQLEWFYAGSALNVLKSKTR